MIIKVINFLMKAH